MDRSIEDRLDRVESAAAISQLPSRYALALDARDVDTLVNLFVDDVDAGRRGRGREALKAWFDVSLRRFYRSIHLICGHQFDFVDADHAIGSVLCRAEHEDGDGWFVIAMRYEDSYERRDGQWCFVRRREHPWYSVDIVERPGPEFFRWPPDVALRDAMPHRMPTWNSFWNDGDSDVLKRLSSRP